MRCGVRQHPLVQQWRALRIAEVGAHVAKHGDTREPQRVLRKCGEVADSEALEFIPCIVPTFQRAVEPGNPAPYHRQGNAISQRPPARFEFLQAAALVETQRI